MKLSVYADLPLHRGRVPTWLAAFSRSVEARFAPQADFDAVVAYEKSISPELNGRSVFDDKKKRPAEKKPPQMSLF